MGIGGFDGPEPVPPPPSKLRGGAPADGTDERTDGLMDCQTGQDGTGGQTRLAGWDYLDGRGGTCGRGLGRDRQTGWDRTERDRTRRDSRTDDMGWDRIDGTEWTDGTGRERTGCCCRGLTFQRDPFFLPFVVAPRSASSYSSSLLSNYNTENLQASRKYKSLIKNKLKHQNRAQTRNTTEWQRAKLCNFALKYKSGADMRHEHWPHRYYCHLLSRNRKLSPHTPHSFYFY